MRPTADFAAVFQRSGIAVEGKMEPLSLVAFCGVFGGFEAELSDALAGTFWGQKEKHYRKTDSID